MEYVAVKARCKMKKKKTSIWMEIAHLEDAEILRQQLEATGPIKTRWTTHDVIRAAIEAGLSLLTEQVHAQRKEMERKAKNRARRLAGKVPKKGGK